MAKLKHIIRQLSQKDYKQIYDTLSSSGAEKSANLLQLMREKDLNDTVVMQMLDVNHNAYYTLRSRLNQKIEEYLLQQMESPRADLLKKVANISEVLFTKKPAIAIATLKKLEKELQEYDLLHELIVVYKSLRKLYVDTPEHYEYSQRYNQSVAYTLNLHEAEEVLAKYFQRLETYSLSASEEDREYLCMTADRMTEICSLHPSHRLFVYLQCLSIPHRLMVEEGNEEEYANRPPIEDALQRVGEIFEQYPSDSIYFHLGKVFTFLKFKYYTRYQLHQKAENYFEEVNEHVSTLILNFSQYAFSSYFLYLKLQRHLRRGDIGTLYETDEDMYFSEDELFRQSTERYVYYATYKMLLCYYAGKFDEAARRLNVLLNRTSLKKYPIASLEIKSLLALQYVCMQDMGLFKQISSSIQRQVRTVGKEQCQGILLFNKILRVGVSDAKREKPAKIRELARQLQMLPDSSLFAPTRLIKINDSFIRAVAQ